MRYYSNLPESVLRGSTMAAIKNGWYTSVPLWTQGTPAYNPGPMPLGAAPMYLNNAPVYLNSAPADIGEKEVERNVKMKTGFIFLVAATAAFAGYQYYKAQKPSFANIYA